MNGKRLWPVILGTFLAVTGCDSTRSNPAFRSDAAQHGLSTKGDDATATSDKDPEGIFAKAAAGAVACFEASGDTMETSFDEVGECAALEGSIWNAAPINATVATRVYWLDPVESADKGAGHYYGNVVFESADRHCRVDLEVVYSGEDISAQLRKPVQCIATADLRSTAFQVAISFAKARKQWVESACLMSYDSHLDEFETFGQIAFHVPFGHLDEESGECGDPHYAVRIYFDKEGELLAAMVIDA